MPPPRNAAVRRFTAVWTLLTVLKLLGLAAFAYLVILLAGGVR